MKRIFFVVISLFMGLSSVSAQTSIDVDTSEFRHEYVFELKTHTNGYFAFGFDKGSIRSERLHNFYHFGIGALRHVKEAKTTENIALGTFLQSRTGPYIFGKQHSLFVLRAGFGQKRFISVPNGDNGISFAAKYEAGLTLGFLKPYYLDLFTQTAGSNARQIISTKYNETYADAFVNVNSILSRSSFSKGWNELSTTYGGHAQAGILVDWNKQNTFITALELGLMLDVFYKEVPIMILDKNQQLFLNVYVSLQLGKRS